MDVDGKASATWCALRDRRLKSPTATVAYEQARTTPEVDHALQEERVRIFQTLSSMVRDQLRSAGMTEEDILADFQASRRHHRRS
jgi:hypothetical protein